MKHYYKIEDSFEIRIIILHTLFKAQRALTPYEISHIVLSSAKIDFFEIHNALSFLVDADEIFAFKDTEEKTLYALTESGKMSAQSFISQIPLEVQNYIDECIASFLEQQKNTDTLIARCVAVNFDEFKAHLEIRNDKRLMMNLDIYAGDETLSKKMCKNFRKHSEEIYDTIISILTKDTDNISFENE